MKELDLRPRQKDSPLPCPFCGAEATVETREPANWDGCAWTHIRCGKCHVSPYVGGSSSMRYDVKEGWNTRMVEYQTADQAKAKSLEDALYRWNTRPHNWAIRGPIKLPEVGSIWRNKNNEKMYRVLGHTKNASNHAGYQPMVRYKENSMDDEEYSRDVPEFCFKFEEVK